MSNPTFTPMPQVYQSMKIEQLEKENAQLKAQHKNLCEAHCDLIEIEQETEQENERMRELVKTAFIEGHNVDYFKDLKRPVLSYWLESESHLALKETGNE